jgi:hypothetical protein
LHREPESLSEADRLVIEDHLQGCESCRADRASLELVRRIGAALPSGSVGPRGHGRAIARALMEGPRDTVPSRRAPASWMLATASLAVGGLAAALVSVSGGAHDSRATQAPPASSEHLSARPKPPEAQPPEQVIPEQSHLGATMVAGELPRTELPSNVVLEAGASARITMRGGSVVAGTSRDGKVLVPRLEAGASWTLPEARTATARPSASSLLVQAREAFTAGDHANAERYADAALDASPSRVQTAEARTIAAECAHSTGRIDDALARYEAIAARFADLPAGETALFAAARLESSRGRADAARLVFDRYLDRYPSGRFVADARRQLRAPR